MKAGVAWRVLRAEGPAAVLARLLDRLDEARRRRSFRPAAAPPPGFACAVLNLASAPPAPRLGGVQAQLLWRLEAEAALRPVALLYPETTATGRGYRLELQQGRERRALHLPPAPDDEAPAGEEQDHPALARAGDQRPPAGEPRSGRGARTGPRRGTRSDTSGGGAGGDRALSGWPEGDGSAGAGEDRGMLPPSDTGAVGRERLAPSDLDLEDPAIERAVAWAAGQCGATLLHVEGLAGMPLASLLHLRRKGLRLALAIHDFAAFCPRPHLLEQVPPPAPPRFCNYSRDAPRCARCLERGAAGLPAGFQESRRELARQLLASADAVVYPSSFLARTHDELFAGAGGAVVRVIPPAGPVIRRPAEPARRTLPARPPLHVAWVGAVQFHKGALVFENAVRRLGPGGPGLRLSAYGGGDAAILARWRRLPGLRVRGAYRAGSLAALLRRERVDLALLLSIVPESYGLTLDECAAAGVPVIAFDHGAVAERIAASGGGLLLPSSLAGDPAAAGAALAELLADLLAGRATLPPPMGTPPSPPPPASAAAAAASWIDLYRDLRLETSPPAD